MKLSTIALAATLATAPLAANAIGIAVEGGTFDLGNCGEAAYTGIVIGDGGTNVADPYSVTFTACEIPSDAQARVTIDEMVANTFFNLEAAWENGETVQVTDAAGALLSGEIFEFFTSFTAATNPQALTFSWTDSVKGAGFDYVVSTTAVPIPAGILLMGTALAGFGLIRRKA